MLVVPHRPGREDQGTLAQRTREAAGQAGQGTRHLAMSYVATARTPGPFAFAQNRARLSPKSSAFGPSPGAFRQVQALFAKSSRFSSSPGLLAQVQAFGAKSSHFSSSPGLWGQVQAFLCQVQALWVKSSRLGPSPRLFGEIYRTSSKSSLKIPSPAPKISCMSPLDSYQSWKMRVEYHVINTSSMTTKRKTTHRGIAAHPPAAALTPRLFG